MLIIMMEMVSMQQFKIPIYGHKAVLKSFSCRGCHLAKESRGISNGHLYLLVSIRLLQNQVSFETVIAPFSRY